MKPPTGHVPKVFGSLGAPYSQPHSAAEGQICIQWVYIHCSCFDFKNHICRLLYFDLRWGTAISSLQGWHFLLGQWKNWKKPGKNLYFVEVVDYIILIYNKVIKQPIVS